jgi:hypothetical protein
LANAATVWKRGVGELPWWRAIRSLTKVVCERASVGLWGVCETQGSTSTEGGPVGVGVRSLTSNLPKTVLGSKGINPAPRNPAWPFATVIDC